MPCSQPCLVIFCFSSLFAGPYESIVESALVFGTVFRVLPFIAGVLFFLFLKREQILGFLRRLTICLAQIPLFFLNLWRRCRSKPAASDEGLRAALYGDSRATGDGALLMGNFPQRKPRLSEIVNRYGASPLGYDNFAETSLVDMHTGSSDRSSLL